MLASAHTGNILQRGIKKQNKERAQERRQVFAATHAGIHTQTRTHIVIAPRAVVAGRPESMPTSGGARRHRQAFCSSSAASSVPLAQEHFLPLKSPRAESSPLRKQQQQQQTGGRNRKKKEEKKKKEALRSSAVVLVVTVVAAVRFCSFALPYPCTFFPALSSLPPPPPPRELRPQSVCSLFF